MPCCPLVQGHPEKKHAIHMHICYPDVHICSIESKRALRFVELGAPCLCQRLCDSISCVGFHFISFVFTILKFYFTWLSQHKGGRSVRCKSPADSVQCLDFIAIECRWDASPCNQTHKCASRQHVLAAPLQRHLNQETCLLRVRVSSGYVYIFAQASYAYTGPKRTSRSVCPWSGIRQLVITYSVPESQLNNTSCFTLPLAMYFLVSTIGRKFVAWFRSPYRAPNEMFSCRHTVQGIPQFKMSQLQWCDVSPPHTEIMHPAMSEVMHLPGTFPNWFIQTRSHCDNVSLA
jgi:hypothetical protein